MFDHSTITHFFNRIGREGFSEVFDGLNQELLGMGLLSPELYVDSSMVKANVNSYGLSRSDMTVEEFKEQTIEANGLLVLSNMTIDEDGVGHEEVRYFQDPQGRLPLSPVDTDARWRKSKPGKPSGLHYQENVVVDGGGFILSRSKPSRIPSVVQLYNGATVVCFAAALDPLAADTAYSVGQLRELIEDKGITAYILIHPVQATNPVSKGDFIYQGDHLICSQGNLLRLWAFLKRNRAYQYVAHQKDCKACPVKIQCLPPNQKRRYVALSMYHTLLLRALERNKTRDYHRERKRHQTIAEGTFVSLDRLGWARSQLNRLWNVDCEGYMAGLAHNVLKVMRRLRHSSGPPEPLKPGPVDPVPPTGPRHSGIRAYPVQPNGYATTDGAPMKAAVVL